MDSNVFGLLADLVLILHVAFVAFVVIGLLVIFVGGLAEWQWIRNPWFRALHLLGIGIVVVQSWLGVICPLTTLEMYFREKAGQTTYSGTFISHWFRRILYYDLPPSVFMVCYTLFGLAVVGSWILYRPRSFRTS